jgi:uncharacterized membrane protein YhaH (DUF805 family)
LGGFALTFLSWGLSMICSVILLTFSVMGSEPRPNPYGPSPLHEQME